ncbi:hypothetical protein V9L05_10810 [Bernardetia sp. Wsw4-3y2]|uniref:hypothetical protein n=1 Tax=Bernardetia sp. Wsw4-3y2 TaxID=3127471 RepID=UPI0030D26868
MYGIIYENIDWLSKNMTQLEAKKVLNYPSPVIRIAAYRSLLNHKSASKFDKNPKRDYELLCQILQEYDIVQASLEDCGVLITSTGLFFSDMYLRLDDDNIQNEEYIQSFKENHNVKDSEVKHLRKLYQILEQKMEDFHKNCR